MPLYQFLVLTGILLVIEGELAVHNKYENAGMFWNGVGILTILAGIVVGIS